MKKLLPWIPILGLTCAAIGWFAKSAFTAGQIHTEQQTDHSNLQRIMPLFEALLQLPERVKVVEGRLPALELFAVEQKQINATLTETAKRQEEMIRRLTETWNSQTAVLSANGQELKDLKEMLSAHMRQMSGRDK